MTIGRLSAAYAVILLAIGCVSAPLAPLELDAAMKRFEPPPEGLARVYVYVPSSPPMAIAEINIGTARAMISSGQYTVADVEPGPVAVSSVLVGNIRSIVIQAEKGVSAFISANWPGLISWLSLTEVDEETGRARVSAMKLAVSSPLPAAN